MVNRIHHDRRWPALHERRSAAEPGTTATATTTRGNAPTTAVRSSLALALVYERLAITLYYTALTTPAVMRDRRLAGVSGDPHDPGLPPGGNPANVRILQAALDAEVKHAAALTQAGATSPITHFYFPASTFHQLGSVQDARTFLGVALASEAACVGLYLVLLNHLWRLGRRDLIRFVVQVLGVESEHRMLSRIIADVDPANDLIIEDAPFAALADAEKALRPFLTGKGVAGGAARAVTLPTAAQTARVIGTYGTHVVASFL
jgi:Ferritin-like domain